MPEPYWSDDTVTVYRGDSLDVLPTLPAGSVDAVVCDPPYGLAELSATVVAGALAAWLAGDRAAVPDGRGFMGREWDRFVPPPALWDECWRVLKPGGHLLAFAAPRTVDLMTLSIRLARFEIRDSITWLFGSGFPKSLDVSKAITATQQRFALGADLEPHRSASPVEAARPWQGWGTALKPAAEPIVAARKPLVGTVATSVLNNGTGALNIGACRVGPDVDTRRSKGRNPAKQSAFPHSDDAWVPHLTHAGSETGGRWPTNVVFSHVSDCGDVCCPGCPVAELDRQSGVLAARGADAGGASRFFPAFRYEAKADSAERPRVDGVAHPTVKPLTLMRWLVRLVTPPGGTVLDPVLGSGTTAEACIVEGFRCIGVERDPAHLPLIVARLDKPIQPTLDLPTDTPPAADPPAAPAPATLFDNL